MVAHDDKFRVLRKLPEVRFEEELRGYSKSQVDRVLQGLAPLADDVAALQQRLADAEARTAAAEARLLEATSARRVAPEPSAGAPVAEVPVSTASFDETLSKTLLLAQRTADQTIAAAKIEADELVGAARIEADQLKSDNERARREAASDVAAERQRLLEAAHGEVQAKVEAAEASLADAEGAQRQALVAQIAEYTALRDTLGEDIERLEGHLAQRREVIRAALADIAVVVDDPARLHSEMPPVAAEPVGVPSAGSPAVVLDVQGLDDLAPSDLAPSDPASSVSAPSVSAPSDPASSVSAPVASTADGPASSSPAVATGSLLGEVGDPTQAVPMVQLLADDAPVSQGLDHDVEQANLAQGDANDGGVDLYDVAEADEATGSAFDSPNDSITDDDDNLDLDLDDWGTDTPMSSGAVIVDEVRWDDAPSPAATPADFGFEHAADHVPSTPSRRNDGPDELSRPAWADAVPDIEAPQVLTKSEDPFLDELRRATGDDAETDVALERFLTDNPDEDDRRSGWFSRRK